MPHSASALVQAANRPLWAFTCRTLTTKRTMATAPSSAQTARTPPLLIQPFQLSQYLKSHNVGRPLFGPLRILDASWHMPNIQPPRNALQEFKERYRIPGAQFWSVDDVATKGESVRGLPHMMPDDKVFAEAAGEHGISNDSHVVVYDSTGIFSSPRTAFTFLAFGHTRVSILDGGLPGWVDAGLPIEEGEAQNCEKTTYHASPLGAGLVRSYEEMIVNAKMGGWNKQAVLDARSRGRFDGTESEPRPGLPSGHIPGSQSLPFPSLMTVHTASNPRLPKGQKYTKLKDQTAMWRTVSDAVGGTEALEKLRQASSGGEPGATATCGSGMTAAVIWLALRQLGIQAAIYDEVSAGFDAVSKLSTESSFCFQSWMGYAGREESPIEKKTLE